MSSYKDLPKVVYQIQNKFRNELRAKSGLFRGREFVMKDMYSFSSSQEEHEKIYEKIVGAYLKVYQRLGLGDSTFRTFADGGIFTNRFSDEFQTISSIGEDLIYLDKDQKIAINQEIYSDENIAKLNINKNNLIKQTAVEVGNTFHLESKYTDALGVYYTDKDGQKKSIIMGCYGIGISRLMGVIAEHFADERGLNWPENVAPYKLFLTFIGDDDQLKDYTEKIYNEFCEEGIEVLYDDRDTRASNKLTDADLLGIPYRVIVNSKTIQENLFEFKSRSLNKLDFLSKESIIKRLK